MRIAPIWPENGLGIFTLLIKLGNHLDRTIKIDLGEYIGCSLTALLWLSCYVATHYLAVVHNQVQKINFSVLLTT